jgi:hypothetical protein
VSAFVRTQTDSAWIAGFVPDTPTFEDFDRKVVAGINGVTGGCYAPAAPIIFDNAGANGIVRVEAPVKVCYGARLTTRAGARLVYSPGQFEQLAAGHPGRTRTLVTAFASATSTPNVALSLDVARGGVRVVAPRWREDTVEAAFSYVDAVQAVSTETVTRTALMLRVHDGATLASVTLTYVAALGVPRVRIVRVDAAGAALPLTLAQGADGWLALPEAVDDLGVQSATVLVDAGVVVNKALYRYAIEIEEDATLDPKIPNYLVLKQPARLATTTNLVATDPGTGKSTIEAVTGHPVIDDVTTETGDIILARAQTDQRENGLWRVEGTGLTLSRVGVASISFNALPDSTLTTPHVTLVYHAAPTGLPKGYVVPVLEGTKLANTLWQMTGHDVDIIGETKQPFEELAAAGNTYVACSVHHIGIADTRWP